VSKVEDWILPDLDRYRIEMEMKSSLQQMMARFLAEMKASYAEMEAMAEDRQEKMYAEIEARA
jgi:hypothetical protein